MCPSNSNLRVENQGTCTAAANVAKIKGRAVLQPKSNQLAPCLQDPRTSLLKKKKKKSSSCYKSPSTQDAGKAAEPVPPTNTTEYNDRLNATAAGSCRSTEKPLSPMAKSPPPLMIKLGPTNSTAAGTVKKPSSYSTVRRESGAGSVAAARREEVALMQGQRKTKIANYGRLIKPTIGQKKVVPCESRQEESSSVGGGGGGGGTGQGETARCSFITPTSDPIYIAYHDEEWGVAVHDDKMLFEMLVLTGAQVGSDWTSVLKSRQRLREAFAGFEAETVAKFGEKEMVSASARYGIDIAQVRSAVDNSKRILKVKEEFGSFDKYLWRFVNDKPMCGGYRYWQKVPAKSSKSEAISKDMLRRGFRYVGPTVIHSFMQAVGLTNDHLITCARHLRCNNNNNNNNINHQPN